MQLPSPPHQVTMHNGNNDCKVYVGNLPQDIRVRDLEDVFYKYGKIVDVDLHNGRGAPFAFIEFDDRRLVKYSIYTTLISPISQRC